MNIEEFPFKTTPFQHQLELFNNSKETESMGVFWEQGCGKTKPMLDTAAYLFLKGKIDAILVVAPNGVHRNWVNDEIKAHLIDEVVAKTKCVYYQSQKANTQWHARKLKELLGHKGLAVFAISFDAFMTKKGKDFVWSFLRLRRCFYIVDEGHNIKTPKAKRTKSIVASGKYAPYRRLLTGTPVGNGPFDLYSQVKFLHENFWKDRHLGSFAAFKQHFGVWLTAEEMKRKSGFDPGYDQLIEYRNIPQLAGYLKMVGHRLTKKDAGLNLPPKLHSKRYFQLTPLQQRIYDDLVNNYIAELEDGSMVEATLAIVRLLRLQQITCGYVASQAEEPVRKIGNENPRLDLAVETYESLQHKTIIWARFTPDIDQLEDALGGPKKVARYDGKVDDDTAEKNKNDFQYGDKMVFIGNPKKGSAGLTLHAAETVMYYSNTFSLIEREQSEDRAHRIGLQHPVNYIDLLAENTVDEHITDALRKKFDIASQITGDQLRKWL